MRNEHEADYQLYVGQTSTTTPDSDNADFRPGVVHGHQHRDLNFKPYSAKDASIYRMGEDGPRYDAAKGNADRPDRLSLADLAPTLKAITPASRAFLPAVRQ